MRLSDQSGADGRPLEKAVQAQVVSVFRVHGCRVYSTSQYRASHVAEGFPDLYVMHPIAGSWWFEVKRPKRSSSFDRWKMETWEPEPLSPKQVAFRTSCHGCGVRHAWGGYREAVTLLQSLGIWRGIGPDNATRRTG